MKIAHIAPLQVPTLIEEVPQTKWCHTATYIHTS